MAGFNLNSLLNASSAAPAAQELRVVRIPRAQIVKNPENCIYKISDIDRLAADISENGLRQPLEVIAQDDGTYMLIGGERRLTACEKLAAEGDVRFERLPCILKQSQGKDRDLIALITANATARELTDGERLAQYEAMRAALNAMKASGQFKGAVRDEMVRRLGESSGNLGRLGAISANCTEEVKDLLRDGQIGISKAYEASKVAKRHQQYFLRCGYVPAPDPLTDEEWKAVCVLLVDLEWQQLSAVDFSTAQSYNYATGFDWSFQEASAKVPGGEIEIILKRSDERSMEARIVNPDDQSDVLRRRWLYWSNLFDIAKRKALGDAANVPPAANPAAKPPQAEESAAKSAAPARDHKTWKLAEELLRGCSSWKKEYINHKLGIACRAYPLDDHRSLAYFDLCDRSCGLPKAFGFLIFGERAAFPGMSATVLTDQDDWDDLVQMVYDSLLKKGKKVK